MDFDLNFHNRDYNIQGSFVGSVIDPEDSIDDPSLNTDGRSYGTGGSPRYSSAGRQLFGAGSSGRWESARLDLNDMGFLSAPDEIKINSATVVRLPVHPRGQRARSSTAGEI